MTQFPPHSLFRRLPPKCLRAALLAVGIWQAQSAGAIGLVQAYRDALQNDSTYQVAKYENQAGQQNKEIARAGLLPNLSVNYSQSKNRSDITSSNVFGRQVTHPEYKSVAQSLSLRQPILNVDALARYHQGVAQSQAAQAQFSGRGQDLIMRLMIAYFDALYADDQLTLFSAQRDTLAEQIRVNQRLFEKGEGTKTDVLETQARLDLAEAQLLEAHNARQQAIDAFATIVGHEVKVIDKMRENFRPSALQPADLQAWRQIAITNNPELQTQNYVIEAARQEVTRSRAGHAPRMDFVASFSKNNSESINTINQDSVVRSVGVQISVPLYSGGYVNATSSQAVANHERAKAEYTMRSDRILNDLQHQHGTVISSAARIEALHKAVESAQLLITATEKSIQGGVRINLDLLNAKQQFYTARRDLAQARYNYLQSYVRLRAAAGVLAETDLQQVAAYFAS